MFAFLLKANSSSTCSRLVYHARPVVHPYTCLHQLSRFSRETRPLDGAETFCHELQKLGYSDGLSSMTIRSSCKLSTEFLSQCLGKLVQRQPLLRARIVEKNHGEKWFEIIGDAEDVHIKHLDKYESDLADVFEELFSTVKYDDNDQYRWKLFRLQERFDFKTKSYINVLLFHCSHALADGLSHPLFFRELFTYLNANDKMPSFPLMPSNAVLLGNYVNWSTWQTWLLLPQLYSLLIRATLTLQSLRSFVNPVLARFPTIAQENGAAETKIQPGTRVLLHNIPSQTLAKLTKECRSQGCSVTGVISAACHIAFCELLSDKENLKSAENDMTIAVNARALHFPKIPDDYIGNYIGTLDFKIAVSDKREEIWEIAKRISTVIREDVRKAKHIRFVSGLEAAREAIFAEIKRETCLDTSKRRLSGHTLSNMGKVDWPCHENDVFKLDNMHVAAASHRMFATFGNMSLTINGKLSWATTFDRSVISQEIAHRYKDYALEIVESLL